MFFETGYILQQCALANNIEHFKMVLESVSCTEDDLLYTDVETGGFSIALFSNLLHRFVNLISLDFHDYFVSALVIYLEYTKPNHIFHMLPKFIAKISQLFTKNSFFRRSDHKSKPLQIYQITKTFNIRQGSFKSMVQPSY